jgi:hypothetical protein
MLTEIRNLQEVARCCLAGENLDPTLSNWLGESLKSYLERRADSIEGALGLSAPRGGVPWWMEAAIRERDAVLRRLARQFFAEHSVSAQARLIRQRALRYAASSWRFDRNRAEMPGHYDGTINALLWRAFKSGAAMPIGERQLRSVLAH